MVTSGYSTLGFVFIVSHWTVGETGQESEKRLVHWLLVKVID